MPPIVCYPSARRNVSAKVFCFQKIGGTNIAVLVRKNPTQIPYCSAKIQRISEELLFLFRIRIAAGPEFLAVKKKAPGWITSRALRKRPRL